MNRFFYFVFLCFLFGCTDQKLGTEHKSSNGLFTSTLKAKIGTAENCSGDTTYSSRLPLNWCLFGDDTTDELFSNSVFLLGENIDCNAEIEFFPLALLEVRSESRTNKIVLGIPATPEINPKEITDFFQFQMNHSKEMKALTSWIELEYNQAWIPTKWEDEEQAKSFLERIIKEF